MQSICDKREQDDNRSGDGSTRQDQLFQMLEDSSVKGNGERNELKRGRKLSEKILVSKLTERSNKISSENDMLFQMEDPQLQLGQGQVEELHEDGQKAKKRRTNQPLPTVNYSLELTHHPNRPLIRDIPLQNLSNTTPTLDENESKERGGDIGKWISIKGIDSGGIKISS